MPEIDTHDDHNKRETSAPLPSQEKKTLSRSRRLIMMMIGNHDGDEDLNKEFESDHSFMVWQLQHLHL